TTDENVFLVASAIVAGKNMDLNEGIRLLTGKAKIVLPFKKKEAAAAPAPAVAVSNAAPAFSGPVTTRCTVVENGSSRNFMITIEPSGGISEKTASAATGSAPAGNGTPVYSPFQGKTELVEINVKVGDAVTQGQVVAAVEAMKAKHDVKAPCSGRVASIDASIGADIEARHSIMTLEA
ncbi:MAG: acetyl-CoA carboxylase biotin carboxyl carrier protein subunit, partial [Thermoanaerobaculales bacterium]|nr:acetyl-CoA carboxylase biotin carboxyl carrier protein subunit [Thermoanaerobaculales bacterium]